jgi:hypothetical protein
MTTSCCHALSREVSAESDARSLINEIRRQLGGTLVVISHHDRDFLGATIHLRVDDGVVREVRS